MVPVSPNFFLGLIVLMAALAVTVIILAWKRKKITADHLIAAMDVARSDGKDPESMIYATDVLTSVVPGINNTVRQDIANKRPVLEETIKLMRNIAGSLRETAANRSAAIKDRARRFADWLRSWADNHQKSASRKAWAKFEKAERKAQGREADAAAMEAYLGKLTRLESMISKNA